MKPSTNNEAQLLYPQTISRRRLPVNFDQDNLPLFGHDLERVIPETRLLELNDVRISSDGFLFRGRKLLAESFAFPANMEQWKRRSLVKFFVNNYALRRLRTVDYGVLWITDDWSAGYFHWLTDALTRLFAMRNRSEELVLLLPWNYQSLDFVQSSLNAFGVNTVEFIRQNEVFNCRRLFLPTHTAPSGHYNEEIIGGVRGLLLEAYGDASSPGGSERLYISRSRAPKRRVTNEKEVVRVLKQFGFQIIYAENHSFAEQVKLCSRARYLVSNHGAGLTNMLFMPQGSTVLELRHNSDGDRNCYFTLASALGLDYLYQTCRPIGPNPHSADLFVDTDKLIENLGSLLKT